MHARQLLRPVVLAVVVGSAGCDPEAAERRAWQRERDSLLEQRQVLQLHQANLQIAAAQVAAQNPPDAAAQLAVISQQWIAADVQVRTVDIRLAEIQYRLVDLQRPSYP
jgi:hypothetical protein